MLLFPRILIFKKFFIKILTTDTPDNDALVADGGTVKDDTHK